MVFDFGDAAGGLDVPSDVYDEMFWPAYQEGARAISNSWGSTEGYYYSYVKDFDEFVYDTDSGEATGPLTLHP